MGKMHTLAIVNMKGGVGKTTTAKNMAYVLAVKFGKKVLLIDMDDGGNLSSHFNLKVPLSKSEDYYGLGRLLTDKDCEVTEVIETTKYPGIDIIPCNATLRRAEKNMLLEVVSTGKSQHKILKKKLNEVSDIYDFCLIDCMPHMDLLITNALTASKEIIIPSSIDADSLERAAEVVETMEQVQDDYDADVELRGLLLTMVSTQSSVDKQGVVQNFGFPTFDTFIRYSTASRQSRFESMMCDEYKKRFRSGFNLADDYDNFVCEYLGVPKMHESGASRKACYETLIEQGYIKQD